MRVLVAGATGFIGRALVDRLAGDGHDVTALTRHPDRYHGRGTPVGGDVHDSASLERALADQDAAYYLVHSLAEPDFEARDRDGAETFAAAGERTGLRQVIYLGGLGDEGDQLSAHLRSRREVETILCRRLPTTALRAGIVIGDGSISWEIVRQLVERLPVMVTPRWVQTRTQPIALADALTCLAGVLGRHDAIGQVLEIGGRDAMSYREMMSTVARLTGRTRVIVPIPVLSPRLSSEWLRLITDVDLRTAQALVESMTNEVVVHDRRIDSMLEYTPMTFAESASEALAARQRRLATPAPERALA